MEKVKTLERNIIKRAAMLIAALVLVAAIALKSVPVITGLIFGGLIAVLNFVELSKTLQRAVTKPQAQASSYTSIRYFIRFTLTGVVLYVAAKAPHIDFIATVVGLLSVKAVVYATHLFDDRKYFKNIITRKEDNL